MLKLAVTFINEVNKSTICSTCSKETRKTAWKTILGIAPISSKPAFLKEIKHHNSTLEIMNL